MSWAFEQQRILVTHDLKTIPKLAYDRVRNGQPMAGVIAIPERLSVGQAIEDLATVTECCERIDL